FLLPGISDVSNKNHIKAQPILLCQNMYYVVLCFNKYYTRVHYSSVTVTPGLYSTQNNTPEALCLKM
ncbi:MAG: hypothetical protein AAB264_04045, partial [Planctomycetota bacterium]